jgi:hypothetical protein
MTPQIRAYFKPVAGVNEPPASVNRVPKAATLLCAATAPVETLICEYVVTINEVGAAGPVIPNRIPETEVSVDYRHNSKGQIGSP